MWMSLASTGEARNKMCIGDGAGSSVSEGIGDIQVEFDM